MSDIHLFLLVPNDSGSTWLQNSLTHCANCVALPTGLDGKGAAGEASYPNQKINKLFSEKKEMWCDSAGYDWSTIKREWNMRWSESPHFHTANPKVFLEKTPQAIYASDMYVEHFDNVRFLISIRNPYAVAEGMRRTIGEVDIARCAQHWLSCAHRQIYNHNKYQDISITLTYEELLKHPRLVEDRIRQHIPALGDVDFSKASVAHSMDGGIAERPLVDYNERQIANLSPADIDIISKVVFEDPRIPGFFGYRRITV